MEGGRIIQVGTPQEIILHPADDYVADFVAHMNPMGILRAAEAMAPGKPPEGAARAEEDTPLKQVMQMRLASGLPVAVGDNHMIDDDAILRALLGR
jgi:glycine betaine/proline transport system ATP-binding protein